MVEFLMYIGDTFQISVFDLLLDLLEGDRVHRRFTIRDAEELRFEFVRLDLEEAFGE